MIFLEDLKTFATTLKILMLVISEYGNKNNKTNIYLVY